jgi:hypothetical protein
MVKEFDGHPQGLLVLSQSQSYVTTNGQSASLFFCIFRIAADGQSQKTK